MIMDYIMPVITLCSIIYHIYVSKGDFAKNLKTPKTWLLICFLISLSYNLW
jgi:hypothetical protein